MSIVAIPGSVITAAHAASLDARSRFAASGDLTFAEGESTALTNLAAAIKAAGCPDVVGILSSAVLAPGAGADGIVRKSAYTPNVKD